MTTLTAPAPVTTTRRVRPVHVWSALGSLYLIAAGYVTARWIGAGLFLVDPGPDTPATWKLWLMHVADIAGPVVFVIFFYRYLVKPWREGNRELTTDGVLYLTWLAMFPLDLVLDYSRFFFSYNPHHWVQVGSNVASIPGTPVENAENIVHPLVFIVPAYVWAMTLLGVAGAAFMRGIRRRWPEVSTWFLVLCMYLLFIVFDLVAEWGIVIRAEMETYHGVMDKFSLAAGTQYQFPLYGMVLWCIVWTTVACLRFFLDDRGRTLAERGVDDLRLTTGKRNVVRVVANIGIAMTVFNLAYNIPMNIISMHTDPKPDGLPSYVIQGVCGENTGFTCPPKEPAP